MMANSGLSPTEETALESYVNTLYDRFGSRLVNVLLFGSKARDEANSGSDIDLAVIVRDPSADELSTIRGLAFDVWLAYGAFLSVRAMSQHGWEELERMQTLFYRHLSRDGISLLAQFA